MSAGVKTGNAALTAVITQAHQLQSDDDFATAFDFRFLFCGSPEKLQGRRLPGHHKYSD